MFLIKTLSLRLIVPKGGIRTVPVFHIAESLVKFIVALIFGVFCLVDVL